MSIDSGQGSFSTPRRVQKCLFTTGNSSCKRIVSQDTNYDKDDRVESSTEEDSDLGPMSPLALTDRSATSCDSSPERDPSVSWDYLTLPSNKYDTADSISPFSSLKKLTKAARYSPRVKVTNPPNLLPSTPCKKTEKMISNHSVVNDEVPETPQRVFATEIQNITDNITETPCNRRSPQCRLVTPLAFTNKAVPLPKIHRRKSLSILETNENNDSIQKENTLKRHAYDHLTTTPAKLFKIDDTTVPKARAALFQERKNEFDLKKFSLSTKKFYSNCEKIDQSSAFNQNNNIKKRWSLPNHETQFVQNNNHKHSKKKHKLNGLNAGVSHGIKKRKSKVHPEILKKEGKSILQNPENLRKSLPAKQAQLIEANVISENISSSEIDENKKFFKTNKTVRNNSATLTVNSKIKLKIIDGKIVFNKKRISSGTKTHMHEKSTHVALDASDLTVDEPDVEATLEKSKVANILKILEEDWADDDYDTMEPLTSFTNTVTPLKLITMTNITTTSPATELINMTSSMNIKDIVLSTSLKNLSLNNMENNGDRNTEKESNKKYFPLFNKEYCASNNIFKEPDIKQSKAVKKNTQWQLSVKAGGEDQYQLDAGQIRFGATQCLECNVVYQVGDPEDENAHLNYHNSIRTLKFPGWKTERIIMEDPFTSSRIILIEPHDSKQYWKKVSDILAVVDRDLGLADMKISDYQNKKVLLYIRDKNVLGVLVAEDIKAAHRMIPELIELDCCTAESTPTKCGINVVWTAMSHRRQGIGSKLVDTLRAKYFYGYVMSLDDIAFSIPTPSGKNFAEKYTKTKNFKVYN